MLPQDIAQLLPKGKLLSEVRSFVFRRGPEKKNADSSFFFLSLPPSCFALRPRPRPLPRGKAAAMKKKEL